MKRGEQTLLCILSILVLGADTRAVSSDSPDAPYEGIVARNLFGLKPPEKPPGPEDNKPPPPKITLNGITSILGRVQVLFKASLSPKLGEPAKEMSFVLSAGQSENEIEVLDIDEKAGIVKFNNHGTIQSLDLEKDGAKLPPGTIASFTPAPGASPAMAGGTPGSGNPGLTAFFAANTALVTKKRSDHAGWWHARRHGCRGGTGTAKPATATFISRGTRGYDRSQPPASSE